MNKKLLNKTLKTYLIYSVLILIISAPLFYYATKRLYTKEADDTLLLHKKEFLKYTTIIYDSNYTYGYYIVFEKIIDGDSYYFCFNDSFIGYLPVQANTGLLPINTGLKVVSKFNNAIWKSGVWYNGISEDGNFNGGLWYNGIFSGNWGA